MMQRAQAKHARILFHRLHDQASTSNSNYLRYIQNRTNNTSASFNGR